MFSTSRELKLRAKSTLRRRLFNILMMAAVFIVANYLLSYLSGELNGSNDWNQELMRRITAVTEQISNTADIQDIEQMIYDIVDTMPSVSYYARGAFGLTLSVLISLMSIPLSAGYVNHILRESRGEETHVRSLIFGFRVMWKALVINLLTWILSALAAVFFVIPGVILLLRWSMALFVLVDNPELGPIACMKESAGLMRGNKWRYFKLGLSFILWLLASYIVTVFIGAPLLNVYLTPYTYLAQAEFYKEIVPGMRTSGTEYQGPEIQM